MDDFTVANMLFCRDIGDLDNEELNIVVCDDASRDVNDSAGSTETLEELRSNAKKSHGINRCGQLHHIITTTN